MEARIGAVTSELFEGRFGERLGSPMSFAEELEESGINCCVGFCFYFMLYQVWYKIIFLQTGSFRNVVALCTPQGLAEQHLRGVL